MELVSGYRDDYDHLILLRGVRRSVGGVDLPLPTAYVPNSYRCQTRGHADRHVHMSTTETGYFDTISQKPLYLPNKMVIG